MAKNPELEVLDIPELVIHGNEARARQHGYSNPVGGVAQDVISVLESAYPGITTSQHFYGNPAFCMRLTLSDFFRSPSGQMGFTVQHAYLRKFPMDDSQWGVGWDYRYGGVQPPIGYNTSAPYCRFGCTFNVNVALFAGSNKLTEVTLFSKNSGSPNQWPERQCQSLEPFVVSGQWDVHSEERVILAVLMYSSCTCNQANLTRPVYAQDITAYIPEVQPYVWRRFGTKTEERQLAKQGGYELSEEMEEKCDQKWHLIRPFYFVEKQRKDGWKSVEEADPTKDD